MGAGLTDLKVTQDSSPERFPWHARKMGWHGQLSWYGEACNRIHGHYPDRYSIVAVEPKPPHVVTVFDLSEAAIEEGTKLWRLLFDSLQVHEASDEWPGYTQSFAVFDVPQDEVLLIDGEEVTV